MAPGQTGQELGIGDRDLLAAHVLVCSRQAAMLRTRPERGTDPVGRASGPAAALFSEHVHPSQSARVDW